MLPSEEQIFICWKPFFSVEKITKHDLRLVSPPSKQNETNALFDQRHRLTPLENMQK